MPAIPQIPSRGDGQSDFQSHVHNLDFEVMSAARLGVDGVLWGCECSQSGSPDTNIQVSAGEFMTNGEVYTYPGGSIAGGAADGTNPRTDLVVFTAAGALAIRTGTAAAFPEPPNRTANDVVLCQVFRPASDTTITDDQMTRGRLALIAEPAPPLLLAEGAVSLGLLLP